MVIRGTVYSCDGKKVYPGVTVSDGLHSVKTDERGEYTLPGWERCRMVFLCALTRHHSDWYKPVTSRKGGIDFFCEIVETGEDFSYLHISDTEIESIECTFIPFLREAVDKHNPAFFINTGDLCRIDGLYRHYLAMNAETVGCPVRYAIGNHDFYGSEYGEQAYEELYGPSWYSFDCGKIHFAVMSIGYGDRESGYRRSDQWEWLINDMALVPKDKKLIIFCHNSCNDEGNFSPVFEGKIYDLREMGLLAWCFGHYHTQLGANDGGVYIIGASRPDTGGIDSSPAGIRKVAIEGHMLTSDIIYNEKCHAPEDSMWETSPGGRILYSTLAPIGDDIIVCTCDESIPRDCGVARLKGEDGKILWRFPTEYGVYNNAVTEENHIYFQDSVGNVFCLEAEFGNLVWREKTKLPYPYYNYCGVLIAGDILLAGGACQVHAFNKSTGELLWISDYCSCSKSASRWIYDKKRDRVIIGAQWKRLYALNLSDGSLAWEQTCKGCWFESSTPLLLGDRVYTFGLDRGVIVNADTGGVILERETMYNFDVSGAPVSADGFIYVPTCSHGALALDPKSLDTIKEFPVGEAELFTVPYEGPGKMTVESTPIIWGDKLIFAASDSKIYIYHRESAALIRRISLSSPALTSPIVTHNTITAAEFGGTVRKIQL
ncbi:MAG: PQQ-binding-like beta-propeller repeat protein [Clostridiales bacterium]|nr:PQQ-binding-like beta-propeller repeat protein [Clostridiales bacterium]